MSELILNTRAGGEFWTDSLDCTADDHFNVFYFAAHDDEQPEAVAYDCDSWAAAADELAGYVKPADFEEFKREFVAAKSPIFDAVEIDWSSRDVFLQGDADEFTRFSGIAYLSEKYAPADQNALLFNLRVNLFGAPWVKWLSPLPASVSLAPEKLEAAALDCLGDERARIDQERRLLIDQRITDHLTALREAVQEVYRLDEALQSEAAELELSFSELSALTRITDHCDELARVIDDERDKRM